MPWAWDFRGGPSPWWSFFSLGISPPFSGLELALGFPGESMASSTSHSARGRLLFARPRRLDVLPSPLPPSTTLRSIDSLNHPLCMRSRLKKLWRPTRRTSSLHVPGELRDPDPEHASGS